MTTLIAASDLSTPARADTSDSLTSDPLQSSSLTALPSNTVTPFDPKESSVGNSITKGGAGILENAGSSSSINSSDNETNTAATTNSAKKDAAAAKRGLVSRRGRGLPTPGQRNARATTATSSSQFETPLLQRTSVTFSPTRDPTDDDDDDDTNGALDLDMAAMETEFPSSAEEAEGLLGPTTPCRNRDDDEKKLDYKTSPPPQQRERDFYASTPTDFALDYGKHYPTSFDTSNVLAWLHSPNPNQLFSPGGGLSSLLNSPRFVPRTPRTPTISTSFFFSDVASLPKNSAVKGSGARDGGNGRDNIICISPLAAKTNAANTPMNLKDVFNSPPRPYNGHLPLLSDTPLIKSRSGSFSDKDREGPSVDAVQQVERDLMEDEDLSVLLQLAGSAAAATTSSSSATTAGSSPTPPRPPQDGVSVFRSQEKPSDLPSLHLPMSLSSKPNDHVDAPPRILRKKSSSREDDDDPPVLPPPSLGMRTLSSSGNANGFFSHIGEAGTNHPDSKPSASTSNGGGYGANSSSDGLSKLASLSAAAAASGQPSASSNPYHVPLNMNGHDMGHYYNMTPATMNGQQPPHNAAMPPVSIPSGAVAGSLRVVVGGPMPPNCQPDGVASMTRPGDAASLPNGASLYHGDYMNGLPASSYPPPGMYAHPHYGQPPMGYRYPPHPGQYRSPGHPKLHPKMQQAAQTEHASLLPSTQQQQPAEPVKKNQKTKGPSKAAAPGTKRPAPQQQKSMDSSQLAAGTTEKKSKKARTSDGTGKKRKNRSPQVENQQICAEKILAVNAASGGKHDKEAEMAAAIMRGVTMRPSGKWQAQLYFAGKSRYIGVFDSREKAALAYEIAREKLKAGPKGESNPKLTENLVNVARKAAFDGVNEKLPHNG